MAILPEVPGVTINVLVAGLAAIEHKPHDDDPLTKNPDDEGLPVTHCYIRSESDTMYAIAFEIDKKFRFTGPQNVVSAYVYTDGFWAAARSIAKADGGTQSKREIINKTRRLWEEGPNEPPVCKLFKFADISLKEDADNDTVASDIRRAKTMGTIRVVVEAAVNNGARSNLARSERIDTRDQSFELAEKATKGRDLSHVTEFVPLPFDTHTARPTHGRPEFSCHTHLGVYYFHYRSNEALRREMILRDLNEPLRGAVKKEEGMRPQGQPVEIIDLTND